MHRQRIAHPAHLRQRQQHKADGQPGIGSVQNPQDGALERDPGMPHPQPHGVQHGGHGAGHQGDRPRRCKHPQGQRQCGDGQQRQFKLARDVDDQARRHVLGEHGHHAACHHALDHDDQGQPGIQRGHRRHIDGTQGRQVEHQVGCRHEHQQGNERNIALVACLDQHTQQNQRHRRQQGHVQCGIHRVRRHHGRHTRCQPDKGQRAQQGAARRGQAGPGFHGCEQKTHNDPGRKAKEHFMRVPQQRRNLQLELGVTEKQGNPHRHRKAGQQGRAQVERPEPQPQQRPPLQRCSRGGRLVFFCDGDERG